MHVELSTDSSIPVISYCAVIQHHSPRESRFLRTLKLSLQASVSISLRAQISERLNPLPPPLFPTSVPNSSRARTPTNEPMSIPLEPCFSNYLLENLQAPILGNLLPLLIHTLPLIPPLCPTLPYRLLRLSIAPSQRNPKFAIHARLI